MTTQTRPPVWPFPPPGGPVPWTRKQIAEQRRAKRQQLPDAPF